MPTNPNDHSVDVVNKPNRTQYDLSESNNLSGQIGQELPVYFREVTVGDTVEITPNIALRFAPTVQPIQTRMKVVIDFFHVPMQAVWKNTPLFFNGQQNNVGPLPEVPYMKIPDFANYFRTGSLSDYLGVPTTLAHSSSIPLSLDFNISFDTSSCMYGVVDTHEPAGQKYYQSCFMGAYDSSVWHQMVSADPRNAWLADPNDGEDFVNMLLSYHKPPFMNTPQTCDYDFSGVHYLEPSDTGGMHFPSSYNNRPSLVSINDSFGVHTLGSEHLYGDVLNSLFCGAVTKLHHGNESAILGHLNGRFYLDNGLLANYNPNLATKGLYVVLMAIPPLSANIGSERIPYVNPNYQRKPFNHKGRNWYMLAYATPDEVEVNVEQRPGTLSCASYINLSGAALANFNAAIDAYNEGAKSQFGASNGSEFVVGFFTYYPADSYDDEQGYFSLPHNVSLAEQRWNDGHPANVETTETEFNGIINDDLLPDPNVHVQMAPLQWNVSAFGSACVFYENVNILGLRCTTMCEPLTVEDAEVLTNQVFSSVNDADPVQKLNAFRWRCYELLHNFWYRNRDLDPLLDSNGHRVINQYLTDEQMADGADIHQYPMHYCLLEKDQFTSCLPEPLVNYAPLVGIREKDNRNVILDFAAHSGISSVAIGAETDAQGNDYLKIGAYGDDIPEDTMSVLRDCINQGISLHDLHSVESLTRWISNHVEHGYNTTDQQLASFGVKTDWNPLTSPIYLGGTSQLIENGTVISQDSAALGQVAGTLTANSNYENVIKHFCKERGWIVGIMRVIPIPCYPSALPADMTKFDFFDFYTPEFDRKGWEPVYYRELCPLLSYQAPAGSGKQLNDVFGYNVPWHDYKFSYDTMHGDMRRNFSNCVLYREFGEIPVLGRHFTECNPLDYNNIFQVESQLDDKFVAQIYFQARFTRPISNPQTRVF